MVNLGPHLRPTLVVATLALVFGIAPTSPANGDQAADRLRAAVPDHFTGQIVVGSRDEVLWSAAFGLADRQSGRRVTTETVFDIGSITKQFTATAILRLVRDGRLRLDDRLGGHFEGPREPAASVTLHQLLTHTSGLPLYSGGDYRAASASRFDRWLSRAKLEFPPGSRYSYSNPGYSALARIVEKISGDGYEEHLRNVFWKPLGLRNLGYRGLAVGAELAVGYENGRRWGSPRDKKWMDDGPSWNLRGNGGLLMNAETLYRWLVAVTDNRVLPADWTARLFERHAVRNAERKVWYGYGWSILERPWGEVVDHTGGNGVFFADARWFRERDRFLVITNSNYSEMDIGALLDGLRVALGLVDGPSSPPTP